MHYWNKDNFEGLADLAEVLNNEGTEFADLAEYCTYREQGLRKLAFNSLALFLEAADTWAEARRREICQKILELHARTPEVHQFLTQPLLNGLIFPVFEKWVEQEPNEATALRWLGLIRNDQSMLRSALVVEPHDVPVRARLLSIYLGDVDYATHHLDEGRLIGSVESARALLADAQNLLETAPSNEGLQNMEQAVKEYDQMLADWEEYEQAPEGTFPEWCRSRNRTYAWTAKYYYDR